MPSKYRPLDIAENFTGVNRSEDGEALRKDELVQAKNLYPSLKGCPETRPGATRFNSSAVVGATRGRNIIRYYPVGGSAVKVAAFNLSGGDLLMAGNDGAGTLGEITGLTTLASNKPWGFTVFKDALYMGNGYNPIQKTTNGATRADLGGTMPNTIPACTYRGRLITYKNSAYPKRVYYTDTLTENCDPALQYREVEHPEDVSAVSTYGRDEDRGIFGDLAIFTPTSMWVQRGDFVTSSEFDRVTDRLGCPSPLSLAECPLGLLGLGYDGTDQLLVFLIPFGGGRPIVISGPIREAESLDPAYRQYACGIYHDGFYKLSFVPSGGTTPTRQWWADLRKYHTDLPNFGIRWWGPMEGQTIGAFAVQGESGDQGELIGADGAAGHINLLSPANTYTDYGTPYTTVLEPHSFNAKTPLHSKAWHGFIVTAKADQGEVVTVSMTTDDGEVGQQAVVVTASEYEDVEDYLAIPINGRRVRIVCEYSGGHRLAYKRIAPIGMQLKRTRP